MEVAFNSPFISSKSGICVLLPALLRGFKFTFLNAAIVCLHVFYLHKVQNILQYCCCSSIA